MNIAILGSDPALLALVQLIADSPDHHLTHFCEAEEIAPQLMQCAPGAVQLASWEDLLQVTKLDIVIVAGTKEAVLTGAKQLATADVSLMLLPTAKQDSVFIYELSLIQDANKVTLLPYLPLLDDPAIEQLRDEQKNIGNILHLQWERSYNNRINESTTNKTTLLSQKDIEQALLHDVALLRNLWGDYNQITAIYSGNENSESKINRYSLATVTLAGEQLPEVVWMLKPTSANILWKLTITGEKGTIVLEQTTEGTPLLLREETGKKIAQTENKTFSAPSLHAILHPKEAIITWGELIRTFETVDATRQSIRRRRTIDLHFETTSERNIFKTQMTAIGCCLLMVTLFLLVAVLFIGSLFHPPRLVMYFLRGAIFLPLFLFLGMQLFIFLTRPANKEHADKY